MKAFFVCFLFVFSSSALYAQSSRPTDSSAYTYVSTMPRFNDEENGLVRYITSRVVYPPEAMARGIQGKVYIEFIVEKDGSVTHVHQVAGPSAVDPVLVKAALKVFEGMPPFQYPGLNNGVPVRVRMMQPIPILYPRLRPSVTEVYKITHMKPTIINLFTCCNCYGSAFMRTFGMLLMLFGGTVSYAQTTDPDIRDTTKYKIVGAMPRFNDQENGLLLYIQDHLVYPKEAKKRGVKMLYIFCLPYRQMDLYAM